MDKNIVRSILVALVVASLTLGTAGLMTASADTVSGNVFLQGDYLELGIRANGTFGSDVAAPAGFHPIMAGGELGFIVDYQKDGWANGTPPFGGDYFMPGTPWEGFGVSCGSGDGYGEAQNGVTFYQDDITADSLVENSINSATWIGHVDICGSTLQITHEIHFNSGDTFVTIDTTIENIGEATVAGLAFGRGLDPDQEHEWIGSYVTVNTVLEQPGTDSTDVAVVEAKGIEYPDMKIWLGTYDERARANAFLPDFNIYNVETLTNPNFGPIASDVAMQIAYDLGTLAPGKQTTVTYWYGFNTSDLYDVFGYPPVHESDITINYNGWQGYKDQKASNGTYRGNNEKGGAFVFAPNYKYKGVTLLTYRGPDQGNVALYLDGRLLKTVNLYRATPQWGYAIPLTFLNGKHTLRVENVGIPKGKFIRMDALKVNTNSGKFTLEDTDPAITWGVDLWKTYYNSSAVHGSYRKSTLNKARAVYNFYGDHFDWITMTGPNLGIARVIIDGAIVELVDLYSPAPVYQVFYTYDGLGPGFHRIRIEATGTHSRFSTGNSIVIDAFASDVFFDLNPVIVPPGPDIESFNTAPQQ